MVLRGRVINGVVVVDETTALPEGAEVDVVVHPRRARRSKKKSDLAAKLRKWAGRAKALPADLARNHDHYLYGVAKR